MYHMPGYTGHVMGLRSDCGRSTSTLAAHNKLLAPPIPHPTACLPLDDLTALSLWEEGIRTHYQGLPVPILRSRLDHAPTPTTLLLAANANPITTPTPCYWSP
ncbi:hypothetical protein OTU49_006401 [Cherax quadricarinatus]|uniref:Uncharacterized protein n=1 Tax=Cherax quadricarinatus TaxID=27406 RepID=A0AAW0X1N5_CHEQU|nr:uncharacterized protein LOC128692356 [Cherax quadricarinatus]